MLRVWGRCVSRTYPAHIRHKVAAYAAGFRWWWGWYIEPQFAGARVPAHELERCGERPFLHLGYGLVVEIPR
ncbi:MAG: hypothetical protein U9Q74_08535 [Gemmatimonadota bacterium]|nr:hypothetical protein [Gemmatimonadota bacterium]